MSIASTATEVYIASAVPDTSASQPTLKDGNNNLANTPGATGLLVPPQSPTGVISSQAPTFNYTNTISSTTEYLKNVIQVEGAQQGTKAISNVASIVASWPGAVAANLAVNNFAAGG